MATIDDRPRQRPTAVVTGGARRLGGAISRALAAAGCDIVIHTSKSLDAAGKLSDELAASGAMGTIEQADLSEADQLDGFADRLIANGPPDILILNAANFFKAALRDTSTAEWDDVFDLNLRAPALLAARVGKTMVARGGVIIFVVDAAAYHPWSGYAAHSIAKAALLPTIELLAKTLAPHVRVNGVAPGPVLMPETFGPEEQERAVRQTLLKRLGEPGDVTRAIRFLCFDAPYVTGAVIPVDGGRHLLSAVAAMDNN